MVMQVRDYTALLSGSSVTGAMQSGAFASFSFPTIVQPYLQGSYSAEALASFRPFSDAEKTAVRQAIAAWAAVSGLTFYEVAPNDGDLKFGNYNLALMNPGAAGFAYYPDNGSGDDVSSDIFIGDGYGTNQHILLHEIGHALGLKHSFEGNTTLALDLDVFAHTVMSYTSGGISGDVLGDLDVNAIRYLYGDSGAKGKQIASWNWDQANFTLTQTGSDQAETINGIGGSDIIYGMGGDDVIRARGGNNKAYGGDGNDTILASSSAVNFFDGGAGDDRLTGGTGDDTLIGGLGNDIIVGGSGFDHIDAGDGSDTITLYGKITGFAIDGGAGIDTLTISLTDTGPVSFSIPTLLANGSTLTGVESVSFSVSNTVTAISITGSDVRDTFFLTNGDDVALGKGGDDYINTGLGNDRAYSGDGADVIYAGGGNDMLWGDEGNDTLYGEAGTDMIMGGAGADTLYGGGGIDQLYGEAGDDTLRLQVSGTLTGYVVDGGDGNDVATITTDDVSRIISGTSFGLVSVERLTLYAGGGNDMVAITGLTNVTADGGAGDDVISVGNATGAIYGGVGNDLITAGNGFTLLYGNAGADRFIFLSASASTSLAQDQLEDFQSGTDMLDITGLLSTNVRIQSYGGGGSYVYADSASGAFALYVRTGIVMADIVTTGLVLNGTSGADRMIGTAGADRLSGGAGNDVLIGGAGSDLLDGGADLDSASYNGFFKSYAATIASGSVVLHGGATEGTDTLSSVEHITFKDGEFVADADAAFAQVERLYLTVLGRAPDAVGLDFYVDQMEDRHAALVSVANDLTGSAEFQQATGGLSNAQFVDYVYQHALARAPDAGGKAYYTQALDNGSAGGRSWSICRNRPSTGRPRQRWSPRGSLTLTTPTSR